MVTWSTVRETVRALSHAGVLQVRQGSGTFARVASGAEELLLRLQRAEALEVYEVRRALEVEAGPRWRACPGRSRR